MLLYRPLKFLFTVSCRRFAPGDVFVASAADVPYLVGLVESLTAEASLALAQVPPAAPSIGWAYPGKGGGGAFMWNAHKLPAP